MKRNKLEPPKKTFFFERWDGSIIATHEEEAWRIVSKRNQTYEVKPAPKLIGVSNGEIFYKAVTEAQAIVETDPEKAKEIIKKGHQDELEAARGNIEAPRNFDTIDKNRNPTTL